MRFFSATASVRHLPLLDERRLIKITHEARDVYTKIKILFHAASVVHAVPVHFRDTSLQKNAKFASRNMLAQVHIHCYL